MARHCPNCGSVDIRRSGSGDAEAKVHPFRSPYRCLRCRERFWVLSRRVRVSAAVAAVMIVLVAVFVTAILWLFDRNSEVVQQQAQKERQMEAPVALDPVMKLPRVLEDHRMPDEPPLLRDTLSQRARQ
jgi:hypothetical protein